MSGSPLSAGAVGTPGSGSPLSVFVTGAAGRLGATIVEVFRDAKVTAHTRSSLDITDAAAVSHAVSDARPDLIINCAAFNDVDGAESAPLAMDNRDKLPWGPGESPIMKSLHAMRDPRKLLNPGRVTL